MARLARAKSKSGIYHVIVRGINRQNIFQDDEDKGVFLDRLAHYKNECGIMIYAYCLMSNHVHLLVQETEKPLNEFMKKVGTSYSYRYNVKYDRVGHLFQDRYKSEPVDDDAYFLTVFRYIHQNPQKAGLESFGWTSYQSYAGKNTGIIDTDFALLLFDLKDELLQYLSKATDDNGMEAYEAGRISDETAIKLILSIAKVKHCQQLQGFEIEKRNKVINTLKEAGLSIRQIERLTGINRGIIIRA